MPSSSLLHSSHKINPSITTTTATPTKSRKQTMFDSENHVYPSDHMSRVFDSYEIDNHASVQETEKTEESWLWGSRIIGSGRKLSIDLDDDDGGNRVSGLSSPPIWRTNPTASPTHGKNHYRSLSPSSRAQAIARGQKELMEMVSKMPESSYELSLKDLVEQPMAEKESSINNNNSSNNRNKGESFREKGNSNNNNDNNKQMMVMKRSGSLDNERFLLKMALPVSLGNSKKSHKRNMKKAVSDLGFHSHTSGGNFHSKVTPRPRTTAVSDGSGKSFDKDWWKKRDSPLFEHDHGGGGAADSSVHSGSAKSSSPNSSRGSNSSSHTRHGNGGGCWSFLHTRRKKKAHK